MLQLHFAEPTYVSYQGVDKIIIKVLRDDFFYVDEEVIGRGKHRELRRSKYKPGMFVPRRYLMVHKLPRQMENAVVGRKVKTAIQVVEKGVKSSLAATLLTNLVLAGSISLLWSFVNTLQMVLYLPLCLVQFP